MKYISKKTIVALLLYALPISGVSFSQTPLSSNQEKENVIAQMNYCINSLTNIIHNKSMSVLEHESDQILNNLTIEQIIGLYEINDFRIDLLDAVSKFGITEQERALLRRIQSIKRDNMKWAALSNALNPTMLLTGNAGPGMGYQLAFQTLLTAARSVVEYQAMKGEENIEELRAMWDLRKEDLKEINEARKEALKIIFILYNKYQLSEKDRLTEATANNFSIYISEKNAAKRIRLLEDNRNIYEHIADYYYHLGMAYLDLGKYDKAKPNFNTYIEMYKKAPLLRYDEKSGCIALVTLANEKGLSNSEKKHYIDIALKNLPHNSAAILQCAIICITQLNEQERGLNLIRAGIEDPKASDQSLLYMAAANLMPIAKKFPQRYSEFCSLFSDNEKIDLGSYLTYLLYSEKDVWNEISNLITFENYNTWFGTSFNEDLNIVLPANILYDSGDISLYLEEHTSEKVTIKQLQPSFAYGVDISDIDNVDCFKENKDLKYLYFDVLIPEKTFIVKSDIDYDKIQKEEWHRQSEFTLTQDDIDDIIDFCSSKTPKTTSTVLKCKNWKGDWIDKTSDSIEFHFRGEALKYNVHHSHKQSGYYLRIISANNIILMFKYEDNTLVPYMYTNNNESIFAKEEYRQEYEYQGEKDPSWYDKTLSKTTNAISNGKKNINQKVSTLTEKAKAYWNNWFSDDDNKETTKE